MARFFKYIFLFASLTFMLSACQEGGEAGDLFGQWRLTGSDKQYISFSGSICLFRNVHKGEVFGKFQHVGDSLFIQCVSIEKAPEDTTLVENTFGFKPFTNIRLRIDQLDDDNLVLSQGAQQWSFYKY